MFNLFMIFMGIYLLVGFISHILHIYEFFFDHKKAEEYKIEE